MKKHLWILTTIVVLVTRAPSSVRAATADDVRAILVERIDKYKQDVGLVVGFIDPDGRRVISYGKPRSGDSRPVDGNTLFEIGSVTKVFTSLLLADMVKRGEVALDDPITKFLPAGTKTPTRNGRTITLHDLATHTSGIPASLTDFRPANPADPFADYNADVLYQFLSSYTLTRDIGSEFEYTNIGAGLLAHLLARRASMDYEQLLRVRILEPMGLKSTGITLSANMRQRIAVGHNAQLAPVPNFTGTGIPGVGALKSTANDLLDFLAAHLKYSTSSLTPAMESMQSIRRSVAANREVGLGWMINRTSSGREIVVHNGSTGGYRSFVGLDVKNRVGIVVLSNTRSTAGIDDIGLHLLDPAIPLLPGRQEIEIDSKLLDLYSGSYSLAPNATITIARTGNQLFAQVTGQAKYEIVPETEHDFFYKVADAQITFELDSNGQVTALVLHQRGRNDQRAARNK